jgi:hypothetical protein
MKDVISGKKLLETLPCIKVIICTQFDFFDRKLYKVFYTPVDNKRKAFPEEAK